MRRRKGRKWRIIFKLVLFVAVFLWLIGAGADIIAALANSIGVPVAGVVAQFIRNEVWKSDAAQQITVQNAKVAIGTTADLFKFVLGNVASITAFIAGDIRVFLVVIGILVYLFWDTVRGFITGAPNWVGTFFNMRTLPAWLGLLLVGAIIGYVFYVKDAMKAFTKMMPVLILGILLFVGAFWWNRRGSGQLSGVAREVSNLFGRFIGFLATLIFGIPTVLFVGLSYMASLSGPQANFTKWPSLNVAFSAASKVGGWIEPFPFSIGVAAVALVLVMWLLSQRGDAGSEGEVYGQ